MVHHRQAPDVLSPHQIESVLQGGLGWDGDYRVSHSIADEHGCISFRRSEFQVRAAILGQAFVHQEQRGKSWAVVAA
jgi:hypothetical protein